MLFFILAISFFCYAAGRKSESYRRFKRYGRRSGKAYRSYLGEQTKVTFFIVIGLLITLAICGQWI